MEICPKQKYQCGNYLRVREDLSCVQVRQAALEAYGTTQKPTFNTQDGMRALGARSLQRERFLAAQRYALNNKGKRNEEIQNFARVNNFNIYICTLYCREKGYHVDMNP